MERYIRAMEKVVIADVVRYKDEIINITKSVSGIQDTIEKTDEMTIPMSSHGETKGTIQLSKKRAKSRSSSMEGQGMLF